MKNWPTMEDSPWRRAYLADLTFGEIYRIVNPFVKGQKLKILDVGCGNGFLSLELARKGHDLVGLDKDEMMIKIGRRAMKTDPYKSKRGSLEFEIADFSSWNSRPRTFDLVIFSRVLHHIRRPGMVLNKVRRILSPRGRIICIEYAYDQFDRRSATWVYHIRRVLEQAGWFSSKRRLSDNPHSPIDQILKEWRGHGREEGLNRFEEMYRPLREKFRQRHFSWKPYIFWDLIAEMRIPSVETEMAVARSLRAMEDALIDRRAIGPILFCFVGAM